ncbi:bacillithiol biosynthesis deacetylase BshB1 [Humisphaera borealis]|uniref:Bacillithiol biosynthesis deacetylase BshB1 n=1 Tax=Humisphaera borealis TaxID=2807512 RepID=A0A7M2X0U9_9BACT|nr:bacillithiol biosynthesis deacetylase BshB1 [Humisphaera borealis]QOV91367.1 bacillithiol biosynthesis deacetylase BshB1 [Humisphaera borealis]
MARFLVFGPHPDDQELGMGGTIAKLHRQGHYVHLVDMTNGEPTPHGTIEIRARESADAARALGVERSLVGLKNREVQHTIEARHKVAAVIRAHRPDVLFVPFPTDAHPDHVAVTRICEDARFDAKLSKTSIPGDPWHPKRIIYYFCTHLRMSFQPTFCIDISDTIDQKMQSIACYPSQFGHQPAVTDMVKGISAYFGGRIGTAHAEPFFTYEVLGLGGLDQLV